MGIISSFQTFELKYDLAWLKFENIWEVSLDQIIRPEVGPLNFKIKIKKFSKNFKNFEIFFIKISTYQKCYLNCDFDIRTTLLSRDNLEKKNNILLMWLFVAACKSFFVCKQWCNWGLFSGYFPQPRKGIIFQFTKIVFLEPKLL